jgi:predicted MFS family arabinose efflux permease
MVMNATETLTSGKGLRISNAAFNFPLITILLSFCALAVVSNTYTMIPINKDLSEAFHVPEIKAAWASSVFSITYAAGFLVFGPLSERYGKKQVLAAGLAVLAACTFICGLVHSFGLLLSFRAVQGFFTAAFGPVALAYVFEIYPTEKRATTIAMITTGFLTSGIIGQVASSWITRSLGWPYVFFVFAITYLLSFLLAWRILPLTPVQAPDTSLLTILKQTLGLLRRPDLVTCFVITFTLLLSFTGMYASLGQYLVSQFGLRADQLLGIRSVGILGTLLSPLAGKLIARFGLKKVLTGALFIACGGLLLEWSMSTLALVTAASVIFVAGISLVNPTMINIVGILGGRASGGAVVMYSFILYIGASAGPMFAQLAKFGTVILILAGLLSVSMILSLSIKIPSAYK